MRVGVAVDVVRSVEARDHVRGAAGRVGHVELCPTSRTRTRKIFSVTPKKKSHVNTQGPISVKCKVLGGLVGWTQRERKKVHHMYCRLIITKLEEPFIK